MTAEPIRLSEAFELFSDHWSPKAIARMNDYLVKLVKVEGEFVWHAHDDTDELFLVIEGALVIDIDGEDPIELFEGDLCVVPAGVSHRPRAEREARILLLEPSGVVNTGDAAPTDLTSTVEWLG